MAPKTGDEVWDPGYEWEEKLAFLEPVERTGYAAGRAGEQSPAAVVQT